MTVETATYISQLSASLPAGGDQKSQGDDHLRLVKSVLQATFPNASRAFQFPATSVAQTTTVNLGLSESNKVIPVNAASGAITVNLPATANRFDGISYSIIKTDHSSNVVTIDGNSSDTINGALTVTLTKAFQEAKLVWSESNSSWYAVISPVVPTGTIAAYSGSAAPTGWVIASGTKTIGNASSGASERANVDTEALFTLLWNTFAQGVCAVSSGRGASASADYAANKNIALPDLRGRAIVGKDDLGGSAASRLTTITGTIMGTAGGNESTTLARNNLPNDNVSVPIVITDPGHTHPSTKSTGGNSAGGGSAPGQSFTSSASATTDITASGSFDLNGGVTQQAFSNLPPVFVAGWIIAL